MFNKLVWNKFIILHKILLTITYITQTTTITYITQTTTITKYFWIYLHPEVVIVIFVAAVLIEASATIKGAWLR
jgi:hypothetical protein